MVGSDVIALGVPERLWGQELETTARYLCPAEEAGYDSGSQTWGRVAGLWPLLFTFLHLASSFQGRSGRLFKV